MATPAEMLAYLHEHCQSDLMFIWTEAEVDLPLQHAMTVAGFCTLREYIGLEDSEPLVRAALATDFGLNVAAPGPAGSRARLQLAAGVSAWDMACQQRAREVQIPADQCSYDGEQEHGMMERAGVAIQGSVPSYETPTSEDVALKREEPNHHKSTASRLNKITSEEDGEVQGIHKRSKVSEPTCPEEDTGRDAECIRRVQTENVDTLASVAEATSCKQGAASELPFEAHTIAVCETLENVTMTENDITSYMAMTISSWMGDLDKMRFRTAAKAMHLGVPLPRRGQRVICRNKDRISAFLCLEDSARMLLSCATSAQVFKDESKPWFHFRDFRDFDTDSEYDTRVVHDQHPDEDPLYPLWWESVGMAVAYGEHRDNNGDSWEAASSAEDDANWS